MRQCSMASQLTASKPVAEMDLFVVTSQFFIVRCETALRNDGPTSDIDFSPAIRMMRDS